MSAELYNGEDFNEAITRCPYLGQLGEAALQEVKDTYAALDEIDFSDLDIDAEVAALDEPQPLRKQQKVIRPASVLPAEVAIEPIPVRADANIVQISSLFAEVTDTPLVVYRPIQSEITDVEILLQTTSEQINLTNQQSIEERVAEIYPPLEFETCLSQTIPKSQNVEQVKVQQKPTQPPRSPLMTLPKKAIESKAYETLDSEVINASSLNVAESNTVGMQAAITEVASEFMANYELFETDDQEVVEVVLPYLDMQSSGIENSTQYGASNHIEWADLLRDDDLVREFNEPSTAVEIKKIISNVQRIVEVDTTLNQENTPLTDEGVVEICIQYCKSLGIRTSAEQIHELLLELREAPNLIRVDEVPLGIVDTGMHEALDDTQTSFSKRLLRLHPSRLLSRFILGLPAAA